MKIIAVKTLKAFAARPSNLDALYPAFDDIIEVTPENSLLVAHKIDWKRASDHLLTPMQHRAYTEAIAPIDKAYNEAKAPIDKAYNEAKAPIDKAYNEAKAVAFVAAFNSEDK